MKNLELWAVSAANGDQTAKLEIINQFRPLLRKYAYKLNYEDAFYDLELKLLEILTMPFFNNPQNTEEQIVSYIHRAIVNEYIRLNKALNVLRNRMILYSDLGDDQQYMVETICAYTSAYAEIDSQLLLYLALVRKIATLHYVGQVSQLVPTICRTGHIRRPFRMWQREFTRVSTSLQMTVQ